MVAEGSSGGPLFSRVSRWVVLVLAAGLHMAEGESRRAAPGAPWLGNSVEIVKGHRESDLAHTEPRIVPTSMRCVNKFWGEAQAQKSTRISENYHTHLALVRSLQEMCLDETWRERNRVLRGGAFLGGAALSVLCVAQGHGREGTTVTIHVMLALP